MWKKPNWQWTLLRSLFEHLSESRLGWGSSEEHPLSSGASKPMKSLQAYETFPTVGLQPRKELQGGQCQAANPPAERSCSTGKASFSAVLTRNVWAWRDPCRPTPWPGTATAHQLLRAPTARPQDPPLLWANRDASQRWPNKLLPYIQSTSTLFQSETKRRS